MVQGAGGLGFLNEATLAVSIGNCVGRKNLDRDRARELCVTSFENDAHAALAQLRFDDIAAERLTDHRAPGDDLSDAAADWQPDAANRVGL